MKIDVMMRDERVSTLADESRRIEGLGVSGVSVTESTGNPFIAAAVATMSTQRVRISTSIALAFIRSPMDMAYAAWDLQSLSGGRFALGMGTQVRAHVERRYGLPWSNPRSRIAEYVAALRAIWRSWTDETELRFEGEFYRHSLMPPGFRPRQLETATPSILLAGVQPGMVETVGEVADGHLGHPFQTALSLRELTIPALFRGLEKSGRERDVFEVTAAIYLATDDSDWERARKRMAFYGSTPAYRSVLELHDLGHLADRLHQLSREGAWAAMPDLVDDDVLDLFAIRAGCAHVVAAELRQRFGGYADRITLVGEMTIGPAVAELVSAIDAPGDSAACSCPAAGGTPD
jgi:probable F420-dependent oxidoreductase